MATFDSPVLHCEVCRRVVLRDTRWEDCARAHHCDVERCPHAQEFVTEHTGRPGTPGDAKD